MNLKPYSQTQIWINIFLENISVWINLQSVSRYSETAKILLLLSHISRARDGNIFLF